MNIMIDEFSSFSKESLYLYDREARLVSPKNIILLKNSLERLESLESHNIRNS
jgi:hypothetical protein